MMEDHPIVSRYLKSLDEGLLDLNPTDRAEVARDIRSHVSEAIKAGKPLDEILRALGSPEELARAYSVELLFKPKAFRSGRNRMLRLIGLVVFGSIPTLIAVVALGAVGVTLSLSGVVLFVAGQAALSESLPWWVNLDADPRLVVLAGPLLSAVGLACLGGLWLYVQLATRIVRKVLPPRPSPAETA